MCVVGWRHAHTLLRRLGIGDAVLSADVRRAGFLRVLFHGPRVQLVYYYYCFSWSGLFCKVTKQPIVFVVCHHKSSGDSLRFGGEIFRVMFFPVFGSVPSTERDLTVKTQVTRLDVFVRC